MFECSMKSTTTFEIAVFAEYAIKRDGSDPARESKGARQSAIDVDDAICRHRARLDQRSRKCASTSK
jgi:hypothetical protein